MKSFEERKKRILDWGADFEAKVAKHRSRVPVFLLGPGYPKIHLDRRRKLSEQLKAEGISAIVMEDFHKGGYTTLTEKFLGLTKELKPRLFLAIFTERGKPLGLTFELGLLTGILGLQKIRERVRYLVEMMVNEQLVMTQYVREQLVMGRITRFRGDEELLRGAVAVVDNYIVESRWV